MRPLKVHMMRFCKQVLADKMAHPVGSKSKLKALAEAKLRKAKVLPRSLGACCVRLLPAPGAKNAPAARVPLNHMYTLQPYVHKIICKNFFVNYFMLLTLGR